MQTSLIRIKIYLISKYKAILKSDIGKRMANGTFWSFTGTALARLIVLIAGIICARILGKDDYGELGMIRSTITIFVTLGMAGLGLTATKFIAEYKKDFPERIPSIYIITKTFSLILAILISILIILLAPIIAVKTLESPYLVNDLRWGGILLFFTILNGIQNGVLIGFENFRAAALNTLYGNTCEAILMCLGAYYYGVTGAIIGFGVGYIVIYICNLHSINKIFKNYNISISYKYVNWLDLKILYKFSIPAALSSLMVAPVFWIIRAMLVRYNGYGDLAIYEAADQWKIIILFIPSAISNVALPIMSSLVKNSEAKFWKILKINIGLNAGIAMGLTLLVILCGNFVMNLYGKGFSQTTTLFILSGSTIFTAIANVIGVSISSRGKMWVGFTFNLIWGIMVITFSKLFLNMGLGSVALALSIFIAYLIHAISQYIYLSIQIHKGFKDKSIQI